MKEKGRFKKDELAEVWNDVVMIKELVVSIVICTIGSMTGYLLAPPEPPLPLLFGFVGIGIGFVLSNLLSKPKRIIVEEKVNDIEDGEGS